jgi:hypothetical protein
MDLAGDGNLDLAVLDAPEPSFYEHDAGQPFRSFEWARAHWRLSRI